MLAGSQCQQPLPTHHNMHLAKRASSSKAPNCLCGYDVEWRLSNVSHRMLPARSSSLLATVKLGTLFVLPHPSTHDQTATFLLALHVSSWHACLITLGRAGAAQADRSGG